MAWMAGAAGRRLEVALAQPPAFDPAFPNALLLATWLAPCLEDGRLTLWQLPRGFDAAAWPRLLLDPGRDAARSYFTTERTAPFLDNPLPSPLWKGADLPPADLAVLRAGWTPLDGRACLPRRESVSVFDYRPGQARDLPRDFGFCREQPFAGVRIEDPYALNSLANLACARQFLDGIGALWPVPPRTVQLRATEPRIGRDAIMAELKSWQRALEKTGVRIQADLVPAHGPGGGDFHDCRITFQPSPPARAGTTAASRVTVLLTGGLDRYLGNTI